ncbi:premnaspirodiene oxygenase-like [Salvia divinorum]|uniref:Premnaspirodiene oxygenase-like n=1 Tax=Salvia divinorum TaxID=28513 RepID=A0ABD1HZ05_SALDI
MVSLIAKVAALVLPAIFMFLFNKWKKSKSMNLPPGPRKLPIIGNLHQISNPPFRCFRDLSNQYGPLMHLKLGESTFVIVSSPDLAKQMLKDLDPCFADRPQGVVTDILFYHSSDIVFSPYGDYWRQMRKLCINELLSPKMVRLFQFIRSDETVRLINSLQESSGSSVNLTEKIFSHSSSITCRAAFGGVIKDNEALMKLMVDSTEMAGGFEIADLFSSSRLVGALSWTKRRLKTMRRKLDVILDDIIDRHKRNRVENIESGGGWRLRNSEFGSEDLVDVFLRVQEEGQLQFPIDNDNIKAVLYDMFIAGTETSSSTIDWTMVELLRHPHVMAKAQAKMTFGLAIVESALAQLLYNFDWKLPVGVRAGDLDMIENNGITALRKHNLFVVATPYN